MCTLPVGYDTKTNPSNPPPQNPHGLEMEVLKLDQLGVIQKNLGWVCSCGGEGWKWDCSQGNREKPVSGRDRTGGTFYALSCLLST